MMSLWDALRMNMMISYQELVRTFPNKEQSDAQAEIRRLQKELKRVTDERDILKKAAAYFAKLSN
ncbi:Uncharacterised protein [Klebsiella pneumoniae]|nr:Uncharacterised protein [Klebsiella pneumoniae]